MAMALTLGVQISLVESALPTVYPLTSSTWSTFTSSEWSTFTSSTWSTFTSSTWSTFTSTESTSSTFASSEIPSFPVPAFTKVSSYITGPNPAQAVSITSPAASSAASSVASSRSAISSLVVFSSAIPQSSVPLGPLAPTATFATSIASTPHVPVLIGGVVGGVLFISALVLVAVRMHMKKRRTLKTEKGLPVDGLQDDDGKTQGAMQPSTLASTLYAHADTREFSSTAALVDDQQACPGDRASQEHPRRHASKSTTRTRRTAMSTSYSDKAPTYHTTGTVLSSSYSDRAPTYHTYSTAIDELVPPLPGRVIYETDAGILFTRDGIPDTLPPQYQDLRRDPPTAAKS
ncbi:uncharacterized protein FIBRA_05952 [Fibroporia radiculosa]|uniref:Transmembrane protein n=1 Tax=Fibroporia radiculosa TaxID=599839 RepID=J4H3T5_9APHY|nr:uncharacterized protein FIBRA_05952 [Fibroporia radiculosa]CCM03804.1 predicted protein [Fibroporia radiculosa]